MDNFARALRLAVRHRWILAGILVSSMMVAVLWGANIGAVYPVIEIVFQRRSLNAEVDRAISDGRLDHLQSVRETSEVLARMERSPWNPALRIEGAARIGSFAAQGVLVNVASLANSWLPLPNDPFQALVLIVGLLLAGTLFKCVFLAWNQYLVAQLAQLTTLELRNRFYRRTLQMELNAFNERSTGTLIARFTNDMSSITNGVATLFGKTLREPLKMIVCLLGAIMISWRLLVLSMVVAPMCLAVMYVLAKSIKRASRRAMEEMAEIYNRLTESITGIKVVQAYTMERVERSRFLQTAKELYRRTMKITWYGALTRTNNELLGVGVICLSLLAGGYLVLSGDTSLMGVKMSEHAFTFGSIMLFYGFVIGVSDPARKLADVFTQLQGAAAAADRIYPLIDRQPAITDPAEAKALPESPQDLVFDNIDFHYQPEVPVLRGVNLRVPAGKTVAIVGPNGCGKSTLINLLLRFYDPVKGTVRWGYTELREVRLRELRKRIGLVTQQTTLFDDTIANNIRYGSPHASDAEVIEAAKQAHADRFIDESLENGYETRVGEGGKRLSGGQRQRIALARAILRDPDLLILDEATSQVDQESEQLIQRAIGEFARDRTCIFITHRMNACLHADLIVVMDQGRVVAVGPHEQLIGECELYQRLSDADSRQKSA